MSDSYKTAVKGCGLNADMIVHMPFLVEQAKQSSVIVELGVYRGEGSTAALSYGLSLSPFEDKLMISIDLEDRIMIRPSYSYWKSLLGDSREMTTLEKAKELIGNRKVDIIYIDTTHSYKQLLQELRVWDNLATDETIFIFHDVWMEGRYNDMTRAIMELAVWKDWVFEYVTKESCGMGILYSPFNKRMKEAQDKIMNTTEPWRYK